MNLFTRMWSPIWSVGSIDPEGILNACTTKVRMASASSNATPSASAYSRSCDLRFGAAAGQPGGYVAGAVRPSSAMARRS